MIEYSIFLVQFLTINDKLKYNFYSNDEHVKVEILKENLSTNLHIGYTFSYLNISGVTNCSIVSQN